MAKHIFVTGGVVSSLGKGLTSACIGSEGTVRLGSPLITQEHLRALVGHEHGSRCAELRCHSRDDGALAHRQCASARPRELDHHGGVARLLHAPHDVTQATA